MTLTKALKKEIASLADAKGRRRTGLFMAEGTKCVLSTIDAFSLEHLIATEAWLTAHSLPEPCQERVIVANRGEIGEITSMSFAPDVIAVYNMPEPHQLEPDELKGQLIVALDRVQDPGNLGTIMRTADWMGVATILASVDTVDCFNPKAVQATMGAISRVRVIYGDLPDMLGRLDMPVYGTFLGGENIYTAPLDQSAVVVMGNEGQGISEAVARCVTRRLLIPSYPPERPTSESLNVATATAIVLAQFRSKMF